MENLEMKLSAICGDRAVTVSMPFDSDMRNFLEACQTLAIGLTFHPNSWVGGIRELADEYEWIDQSSKCNNDE